MNTQTTSTLTWHLDAGRAQRLASGAGELTVLQGRVWITGHDDDDDDQVLSRGERLRLADAAGVVVEPWDRAQGAVLRWAPQRRGFQVFGLRTRLAGFFAAFARRAASSASRPQGCM